MTVTNTLHQLVKTAKELVLPKTCPVDPRTNTQLEEAVEEQFRALAPTLPTEVIVFNVWFGDSFIPIIMYTSSDNDLFIIDCYKQGGSINPDIYRTLLLTLLKELKEQ